jgi:hypothetical protein
LRARITRANGQLGQDDIPGREVVVLFGRDLDITGLTPVERVDAGMEMPSNL